MIPDTRITYNGARVRLVGVSFEKADNIRIIEAGFLSIKNRLARGIGQFDTPTPELPPKYARRKIREGAKPIHDLRLTGALLDREIKVRYADDNGAVMDAQTRVGRIKARTNSGPLLFSESDQAAMSDVAAALFHDQVAKNFSVTGRYASPRTEFTRGTEFSR